MNAVEVKELTKKFKGFTLDHVSFHFLPGASWAWWVKTEPEKAPH